jgi:transposase
LLNYGLDVHKKYTSICVMDDQGTIIDEGRALTAELPAHPAFSLKGEKRAVMEAGGNWHFVYDILEPHVDELMLAHPLRVRAIATARVKTDTIDARTLAHLLRSDLIPAAYVPPPEIRELRELLRFRLDLVKQRTATKNRVHSLLTKAGFESPVADAFGRRGRQWLSELSLPAGIRCRLDGFLRVLDCLAAEIKLTEERIRLEVAGDPNAQLLLTIPGIGALSALLILSEIGDVHRFLDASHLVSYAGLAPRVRSSAGRTKLGQITKQGPSALRWVLVEATHMAVRRPGRLQEVHRRLRAKKSSSVAVVACARQMLIAIYWMLKRGVAFRADGSPGLA